MPIEWPKMGRTSPHDLVVARLLAHHTLQWAAKAACANLQAAPDDSHTAFDWDAEEGALLSRPMPARHGAVRVGLNIAKLQLMVLGRDEDTEVFPMEGATDAEAGAWLDDKLRGLGLAAANGAKLPYALPTHPLAANERFDLSMLGRELGELSRWYGGCVEALDDLRISQAKLNPGPLRCWPHHFDIATLLRLETGSAETARSIGVGVSPGDEYYAQPYVYVSPWPRTNGVSPPALPAPGRWHTDGFFGAVLTAEQILTLKDRGAGLRAFIEGAVDASRAYLQS